MKLQAFFGLTLVLISSASPAAEKTTDLNLQRLDPHGKASESVTGLSIVTHSECKVCHIERAGHLTLKPEPAKICASCHGQSPHSGAAEHLAHQKVTCLSCHFPHRADPALKLTETEPSIRLERRTPNELPDYLVERIQPSPRLRKRCEDCHK